MNRKHHRHEGAPPKETRHSPQNQKKQDGRRRMEQDTGKMMSAGFQSIQLAIQHMRNPRHRMPVIGVKMSKGPDNPMNGQSLLDNGILIHVIIVIKIDESEIYRLAEDHPDNR